jgi:hypothetical protein
MSKQVMALNVLAEFVANTFNTPQVLVEKNNRVITVEPMISDKSDSTNQEMCVDKPFKSKKVDKTKAGTLTLDDFKSAKLFPKGYKFNRDDAYDRE